MIGSQNNVRHLKLLAMLPGIGMELSCVVLGSKARRKGERFGGTPALPLDDVHAGALARSHKYTHTHTHTLKHTQTHACTHIDKLTYNKS